jgi:hypothetical protein
LYGVEGEKQHGIDIIGIRPNQPLHRPTYYQCKNVEKFSGADLNKAIDAFQTGPFAAKASELVLIVRAPSKTNLLDAFMIRRLELAPRQIDLELWAEEELFEKLDYHPEIIDKFFGPQWASEFCIRRRTRLTESTLALLIDAAKTDPVFSTRDDRTMGFTPSRSQNIYGDFFNNFVIRNREVIIRANLPIGREPLATCMISFRQQSASAVQIALSHSEMIRSLFAGHGSGASKQRGFYRYSVDPPYSGVMIGLGDTRLNVSDTTYGHLCEAVDGLFAVFKDALAQLDRDWESSGYQFFVRSDAKLFIQLGDLPYQVWQRIVKVSTARETEENDDQVRRDIKGNTHPLRGVSAHLHALRVHTYRSTAEIDAGRHLSIWRGPVEDISTWNGEPYLKVDLFWQPPAGVSRLTTQARGRRGYWGCETTVKWIETELLNAYFRGVVVEAARSYWVAFKRKPKPPAVQTQPAEGLFHCKKEPMLLPLPSEFTPASLLEMLERLWAFTNYVSWKEQFNSSVMLGVYAALRFSLKYVQLSYLDYVINNLDLEKNAIMGQSDLIQEIVRKSEMLSGSDYVPSAVVEYGIRALKEVIAKGEGQLNSSELGKVAELLETLIIEHDEQMLLQLHTPKSI